MNSTISATRERSSEMPVEFTGSGGEYFRIWIVNLVLTILTLGIYSAWAKVRTKRYFYRNTIIGGSPFEYHARPIQILKGRAIVVGAYLAFSLVNMLSPILGAITILVFLGFLPWLVVRASVFNARNSSWRDIRFNFNTASKAEAGKIFLLFPFLSIFTLGLLTPYITYRGWRFAIANARLGTTPFKIHAKLGKYYAAFFISLLMVVGILVSLFIIGFLTLQRIGLPYGPESMSAMRMQAMLVPMLAAAFFILAIPIFFIAYRALTRNASLNATQLGPYQFESTLRVGILCWITFSNLLAIIVSVGLLMPWARVRMTRYLAVNLIMHGPPDLDTFVQGTRADARALGEEASDFFDVDIGGV
jgi:uncharacterized membrane protein YjgN (DUF898 family)